MPSHGAKTHIFAPFHTENDDFTKTGSGQTEGNLKKEMRFSHADSWPRSNWLICNPRLPSLKWLVQTPVRTNERTNERTKERIFYSFILAVPSLSWQVSWFV